MRTLPKMLIIVGSTRPGRIGRAIADWFYGLAKMEPLLRFELVDLALYGLPLLDEPVPAKVRAYQHDHTKSWSSKIASGDGYVLVTPEYNHGYPASLKNALDYLYHEWAEKPVGFLGYGWGGGRMAVAQLRPVVQELHLQPVDPALLIALKPGLFDEHHQLVEPERALSPYRATALELIRGLVTAPTGGPRDHTRVYSEV